MQTINFIEEYDVPGVGRFAIEDYEDGAPAAQHFFPHTKHKRYHLWRNGCGIGQADTLQEAQEAIHAHARHTAQVNYIAANQALQLADQLLADLVPWSGSVTKCIQKFKVKTAEPVGK